MKIDRMFFFLLIILAIFSVMMAGCTSKGPEPAPSTLPTTAHAEKTPIPVETISPEAEQTSEPEPTQTEEVTALSALSSPSDTILFEEGGISLRYPARFSPISESSLEKMREVAKPQGIDILTILTAGDSKDSIQVTRQTADTSIEGMFNEKLAIANEVTVNGSATVVAMTFVRYEVEKQTLADGTGAVKVTAENSDKGTAVTYLLYSTGTVYNINYIYESPERAESQASVRDGVLQTLHLV